MWSLEMERVKKCPEDIIPLGQAMPEANMICSRVVCPLS